MTITQFIGWLGAVFYILAYLLLSLEILKSDKKSFHVLNIAGAVCLIVNALPVNDYPTIVVNVVWGVIGVTSIVRIILRNRVIHN